MNKDEACPEQEVLSLFSSGQLPSDQVAKIGEHVEACDDCADTLNLLSERSDTLVAGLRNKKSVAECSDEDRARVVNIAKNIRETESPKEAASKKVEFPAALKEMASEIVKTGLLTNQQLIDVVSDLPVEQKGSTQEFAKALIRSKQLTKFQATAVYQGKTQSLVFGEYVVLDKIGEGGMGMVFRAQHRRMKREVAIKVLPGGALDDEDAVNRFYREVEAAAKLLHTNIVTAFDAGQHGKSHFLVMEFVDGKDLSAVVKENGPLPIASAIDMTIQAARGLEYAHDEGLVHRDIKPANLLVDKKGTVKILDMGLARLTNAGMTDDGLTKSGQIMGTVDYMAPEQATDTRRADARADIYSLGCTLYRLLTGAPMFEGETIMNKMMAHATETPPDLRVSRPDVSDQLNAAFQKMVAKSPDERQQSMTEVIADLTACLGGEFSQPTPVRTEQSSTANESSSASQLTDFFDGIDPAAAPKEGQATAVLEQTIDEQAPEIDGTISQSELSGASRPAPAPQKQKSRRGLFIGLTVVGLLALLGVITIFLSTSDGTVKIVFDDSILDVEFDSKKIVINGREGFKKIKFLPGNDHKLKITRGDFTFFTDKFELKKGKNVVIQVTYLDGKVKVVKGGIELSVNEARRSPTAPSAGTTPPPPAVAPFDTAQAKAHQKAWADYLGEPVETTNSIGMKFVVIPPGEFTMGEANNAVPVKLTRPLRIGVHEVTQGQWKDIMGTEPWKAQENVQEGENVAASYVDWPDTTEFCRRLTERDRTAGRLSDNEEYRLPTEAEWEFTCRAGATTTYSFGDDSTKLGEYAWHDTNTNKTGRPYPHAVGLKRANAWGLHDVHGNLWEWCNDWGGARLTGGTNPQGPSFGRFHVFRGGSWPDNAVGVRTARRIVRTPVFRPNLYGFRVVKTLNCTF